MKNHNDLKIIDELLCLFKPRNLTWKEFSNQYSITNEAMNRLKLAWICGEMDTLTLSLSNHFKEINNAKKT